MHLHVRESVSSWLVSDKNTCYMDSIDSMYVCVTIIKHTQCKQMVMINRDIGLYYKFQLQRENCKKKLKIIHPEVHFYCFPFLLLAIICIAKREQRIDYLTRMFTRVKMGSLKMKGMSRGGGLGRKGVEKLLLFVRNMFSPKSFVYILNLYKYIFRRQRNFRLKKSPNGKMKGLHFASQNLQVFC